MSAPGSLIILSAPSGAGKTSLVKALLERTDNLRVSVSHTTRPRRPTERDGIDYHFVDRASFEARIAAGEFLEHADVFGHLYGTSGAWVADQLAGGTDVLLEIDYQGAAQVRGRLPDARSVFILPPSPEALEARLVARGQDDPDVIRRRLATARAEVAHCGAYDYLVINDDFGTACADLEAIVRALRLSRAAQTARHGDLIARFAGP
jgi:guanylate kinase